MLLRANFRLARRRRATLLGLATLATVFAAAGLISTRHATLSGGFLRHAIGDLLVLAWAAILVLPSFAGAVKPRPVRAGAIGALVFGPLLMPLVFGPGGWTAWTIVFMLAACAAALVPPRSLLR